MLPPSTKPYLIRALYEWCVDQDYTPHILVEVDEQCRVPMQFVKDGTIILNIGPNATKNLTLDNEWVQFTARFSGVSQLVAVPVARIGALYTRETQKGMGFDVTSLSDEERHDLQASHDDFHEESFDDSGDSADTRSSTAVSGSSYTSDAMVGAKQDSEQAKQEARARFKLVED